MKIETDCTECPRYYKCYAEDGEKIGQRCAKARDEEVNLKELQRGDERGSE